MVLTTYTRIYRDKEMYLTISSGCTENFEKRQNAYWSKFLKQCLSQFIPQCVCFGTRLPKDDGRLLGLQGAHFKFIWCCSSSGSTKRTTTTTTTSTSTTFPFDLITTSTFVKSIAQTVVTSELSENVIGRSCTKLIHGSIVSFQVFVFR